MENIEMQPDMQNKKLLHIVQLAEANEEDGWEEIDSLIKEASNDSIFIEWARKNTKNLSSGLRDLAATIFEASGIELSLEDIALLQDLMNDEGYPKFRAACALAKRINVLEISKMKGSIKSILESFADDPDVFEIAKKYLNTINI